MIEGNDIPIGSDQYWQIVTGEVRRGESGPKVLYTRQVYVDPIKSSTCDCDSSVNLVSRTHVLRCAAEPSQPLKFDLTGEFKRFGDLESLGISSPEQQFLNYFIDSISFQLGRYEIHLSWTNIQPVLPDNYETSHKRLISLLNCLRREP